MQPLSPLTLVEESISHTHNRLNPIQSLSCKRLNIVQILEKSHSNKEWITNPHKPKIIYLKLCDTHTHNRLIPILMRDSALFLLLLKTIDTQHTVASMQPLSPLSLFLSLFRSKHGANRYRTHFGGITFHANPKKELKTIWHTHNWLIPIVLRFFCFFSFFLKQMQHTGAVLNCFKVNILIHTLHIQ